MEHLNHQENEVAMVVVIDEDTSDFQLHAGWDNNIHHRAGPPRFASSGRDDNADPLLGLK